MRSPVHAVLWEIWRVTRVEVIGRLALGIVGGLAALVLCAAFAPLDDPNRYEVVKDFGAVIAMTLLVLPHFAGWLFLPRINSWRPGFPLYLLYTRPIRTAVMVGLPMAYLTAVPAAIYLLSALLLRAVSGYPFPLLPVAAWIAALNLVLLVISWSARSMVVKTLGIAVAIMAGFNFTDHRLNSFANGFDWHDSPKLWSTIFDFPLTDYALIALIGLASFGIAVARVARQRRGDAPAAIAWNPGAGFSGWLVNLYRLPCPTSSAMRAQVWFDLKSTGLPVLTIGVVLALLNPLMFAVTAPVESAHYHAAACGVFSVLTVLALGVNALGIRWRQGRGYATAFEATQPSGTARLACLKVLVRSVCILAALAAVIVSVWASLSFIAVGKGYEPLRSWQSAIEGAVGALTGYQQVALAVVASIGYAVLVASLAAFTALAARYPRRPNIGGYLLLLNALLLVLLMLNGYRGLGSEHPWKFLLDALIWVTRWIDTPAIVLATVYVSWRVFAERLLTLRQTCGVILVSAAFGAAWVTVLRVAGVQFDGMATTDAVWMLSPLLLPLMASVLAPWSLNRIRHT